MPQMQSWGMSCREDVIPEELPHPALAQSRVVVGVAASWNQLSNDFGP